MQRAASHHRRPLAAGAAAALLALGGCTTINVYSDKGVVTHRELGLTRVVFPADAGTVATDIQGLGIVMGSERLTFGYLSEQAVALRDPARCQVLFMAATAADARAIRKILDAAHRDLDHICILSKGESK